MFISAKPLSRPGIRAAYSSDANNAVIVSSESKSITSTMPLRLPSITSPTFNRYSLCAEFGSKQALFDVGLERYDEQVVERNFGPLEPPTSGVEKIRALLEFHASASNVPAWDRGCLLCNTAVEFGHEDPGGAEFVQRYFRRLANAFYKALSNAHSKGVLRDAVAVEEEADYFTASTLGLFVLLRPKAPSAIIEDAARMAIEHLEGLCL